MIASVQITSAARVFLDAAAQPSDGSAADSGTSFQNLLGQYQAGSEPAADDTASPQQEAAGNGDRARSDGNDPTTVQTNINSARQAIPAQSVTPSNANAAPVLGAAGQPSPGSAPVLPVELGVSAKGGTSDPANVSGELTSPLGPYRTSRTQASEVDPTLAQPDTGLVRNFAGPIKSTPEATRLILPFTAPVTVRHDGKTPQGSSAAQQLVESSQNAASETANSPGVLRKGQTARETASKPISDASGQGSEESEDSSVSQSARSYTVSMHSLDAAPNIADPKTDILPASSTPIGSGIAAQKSRPPRTQDSNTSATAKEQKETDPTQTAVIAGTPSAEPLRQSSSFAGFIAWRQQGTSSEDSPTASAAGDVTQQASQASSAGSGSRQLSQVTPAGNSTLFSEVSAIGNSAQAPSPRRDGFAEAHTAALQYLSGSEAASAAPASSVSQSMDDENPDDRPSAAGDASAQSNAMLITVASSLADGTITPPSIQEKPRPTAEVSGRTEGWRSSTFQGSWPSTAVQGTWRSTTSPIAPRQESSASESEKDAAGNRQQLDPARSMAGTTPDPTGIILPFAPTFTRHEPATPSQNASAAFPASAREADHTAPQSTPQMQATDAANGASGQLAFAARLSVEDDPSASAAFMSSADDQTRRAAAQPVSTLPASSQSAAPQTESQATVPASLPNTVSRQVVSGASQTADARNGESSDASPKQNAGDGTAKADAFVAQTQVAASSHAMGAVHSDASSDSGNGPTSKETPAPAMSPAARMDKMIEPPATPASANHDITVRIPDASEMGTAVRFVERAGEVHVSVRTGDAEMAQTLRGGLGDLVNRLADGGVRTEVWQPGSGASTSQDDPGQPFADSNGSKNNRESSSGSETEQDSSRQNKPRWLEELESSIGDENVKETSQLLWQA